jgi:hypothetical protein
MIVCLRTREQLARQALETEASRSCPAGLAPRSHGKGRHVALAASQSVADCSSRAIRAVTFQAEENVVVGPDHFCTERERSELAVNKRRTRFSPSVVAGPKAR